MASSTLSVRVLLAMRKGVYITLVQNNPLLQQAFTNMVGALSLFAYNSVKPSSFKDQGKIDRREMRISLKNTIMPRTAGPIEPLLSW